MEKVTSLVARQNKIASVHISAMLDYLGYNDEMVKYRQRTFQEVDSIRSNAVSAAFSPITTGGKGEGTARYYENDVDYLYVLKDAVCIDTDQQPEAYSNSTVFLVDRNDACSTAPGYTRLKLLKKGNTKFDSIINASLRGNTSTQSRVWLSSEDFLTQVYNQVRVPNDGLDRKNIKGPSMPYSSDCNSFDTVFSFRYLKKDLDPSLYAHVVPVGSKGSDSKYLEWRICFTTSEKRLVTDMNAVQIKLYILLKKISKDLLQPVSKRLSSYIMKNILFWIIDKYESTYFTEDNIVKLLLHALSLLKTCIIFNHLPSFTIFERNLLAWEFTNHERSAIVLLLDKLIKENASLLLRCDRLHDALMTVHLSPTIIREYGTKRDEVERIVLQRFLLRSSAYGNNESSCHTHSDIYSHLQERLLQLICTDFVHLLNDDTDIADVWEQTLCYLLS